MPKKGGKPLTERERARLAVIPTLYELYTPMLSEQTVDMIAKQCNYDLDECIAQLGELMQPTSTPSSQSSATSTASAKPDARAAASKGSAASSSSSSSASTTSSSTSSASAAVAAAAASVAAAAASAPAPVKKGILFLSPRPLSELNRPQPASVWTKSAAPPATKLAWGGSAGSNAAGSATSNNAAGGNAKDLIAAASLAFRTDLSALAGDGCGMGADPEEAYGSDSNDQEDMMRLRRATGGAGSGSAAVVGAGASADLTPEQQQSRAIASYTYTGFESQPYFDLAPRLADAMPPLLEVRAAQLEPMLDPEAPSAQAQVQSQAVQHKRTHQHHSRQASTASTASESKDDAEATAALSASSPAHPAHALHALYLQLNAVQDATPAPTRASWSSFAPGPAAARPAAPASSVPSQAELESMTPAQALAWQRKQHAAELSSRREFTGWMKQHEKDKRAVRAHGALDEEAAAEAREREAALAAVAAAEAEAAAAAAAFAVDFSHLSLQPTDIPPMAALSRSESRRSQEVLTAAPEQLVRFLEGLFGADIDSEIIRAVVESVLAEARRDLKPQASISQISEAADTASYSDLASQCCTTLLAILEEDEQAQAAAIAAAEDEETAAWDAASPSAGGAKQPRGGKANKKAAAAESASQGAAPFVAQGLQMSDAEIAHRMSIDPSFDPNAAEHASGNALAAATLASTPSAAPQRNKKGHIVLDFRSAPNAWAAHTPAAAAVAPTLTSQWNLRALTNSFPLVDADLIEQAFAANGFNFAATRAHLSSLFPGSRVDGPQSAPQPVDQPWARRSQHHSKVVSTSAADAARGIVTEDLVAARNGAAAGGRASGIVGVAEDSAAGALSDEQLEAALGNVLDNRGSGVAAAAVSASSDSSLRALASVHARRRAAYFGAAAVAFNRGAGAVASELANKGRAERAQLLRTQAAAVLATFAAQNTNHDCTRTIDLHGLRVGEALRILQFVLARHRRSRLAGAKGAELQIVTGLGLHSAGGISKARLGPAVVEYLRSQGIAHSTASEGVVKVFFR